MAFVLRWKVANHELGDAAQWKLDLDDPLRPTAASLSRLQNAQSLGAVVNEAQSHWTAIRWEHGTYWLLDSLNSGPVHMTMVDALAYIERFRNAFLLTDGTP